MARERIAALIVQGANGGSDLIVRISGDVLHHEVDETRITLENSEDLNGAILRLGLRFDWGRFRSRLGSVLRESKRLSDVGREFPCEKDRKKTTK